ncbi:hypothetical protein MASR2M44_16620 [Bacteroidota bacterium]
MQGGSVSYEKEYKKYRDNGGKISHKQAIYTFIDKHIVVCVAADGNLIKKATQKVAFHYPR